MRLLTIIAFLGAALWAYNERMIPGLNQPAGVYNYDGTAETVVFTTANCGKPCADTTAELYQRRAKFRQIEISAYDQENPDVQLWKKLGGGRFPFLVAGEHASTVSDAPEVATILAKAYGDRYLTTEEKTLYAQHFNQYDEPIVVVYGADWCRYCVSLQEDLSDDGIEFIEIDVEKHRNRDGISKTMDIRGYPSAYYGFHRVSGTDIKAVKRTMKLAAF